MIDLKCSSMDHVIDRATAFLWCQPPYHVVAVKPDGVILARPDSEGIKGLTYYVKLAGRFDKARSATMSLSNGNGSLPSPTLR